MKQEIARELLFLERTSQLRELSSEEMDRWQVLANSLFGHNEKNNFKRKSSRLPISTKACVDIHGKSFDCEVTEISQANLTLAYDNFENVKVGDRIKLKSLLVNSDFLMLNLDCEIMRLRGNISGKHAAGIEIMPDSTKDALRKYNQSAYYPLYLKYLEATAASK